MALIDCPDCGKQISDTALTCIGCGRLVYSPHSASPERKAIEKKGQILEWIGAILMLGSIFGCSVGVFPKEANDGWLRTEWIGFLSGLAILIYGRRM